MQATDMNVDAKQAPLLLPETLDIAAAESFLELVRHRVNDEAPLCIDASAVETITLPCIQIIFAALHARESISIKKPSAEFINAFEDLGLFWMNYLDVSQDGQEPVLSENFQPSDAPQADDAGSGQPEFKQVDAHQISESVMGKRILTIDDSKTMRDMLMLTLAEAGFDVLQAVDGQDGLDVLGKEQEQVHVVITDINMPRMDGYEVIRKLRQNPTYKSTPILVLTTESETEKKNLAREAGATGWMVKPFDPDRLVETVRKVAP
jgi:two-component system chemotaxis response regulator CheY